MPIFIIKKVIKHAHDSFHQILMIWKRYCQVVTPSKLQAVDMQYFHALNFEKIDKHFNKRRLLKNLRQNS